MNLTNVNFEGANFYGAYLNKSDLSDTNLKNSNFEGTDLRHANLSGSDLSGSLFKNTKLIGTAIDGVTYDEMSLLLIDHTFQNTMEPFSDKLGYGKRAIDKIFDKYIFNSI